MIMDPGFCVVAGAPAGAGALRILESSPARAGPRGGPRPHTNPGPPTLSQPFPQNAPSSSLRAHLCPTREVRVQGGEHRGAFAAVEVAEALDLRAQEAAGTELVDDRLIEHAGAEVGGLLGDLDPAGDGRRRDDPAAAQTGRQDFRER